MDLRGKRVTIFGMGRSAYGAARLLLSKGALPFVTDSGLLANVAEWAARLEEIGVPYETDGHTEHAMDADLAVVSPGVPASIPPLEALRTKNVPVIAELELAWRFCERPVLALTGTNGKTTTTELLRAMVAACGHTVALAGNNDRPFSEAVSETPQPEYFVLEVSSYQLETVDTFHPWIAAVLNLTPDHLKRHGTMEGYAAVKARIFQRQGLGDTAVLNGDDAYTRAMETPDAARRVEFSLDHWALDGMWLDGEHIRFGDDVVANVSDNPLPGRHNLENVLAALAMMRAGRFDWNGVLAGLRAFKGVEHRIEYVLDFEGVPYYNDSKSTNIDSLRVALESFGAPIVLIAGGRGKGSDYGVLRDLVAKHVATLITLGEDAPLFEAAFGELVATQRASSMADAVTRACAAAKPGEAVLLSPGCASFDMYRNFEERGRDFKALVRQMAAGE